jgi:hypothetical protein
LQLQSVSPLPLHPHARWPVRAACPVACCGWKGDGLLIVADLEEFFARIIFRPGERRGDPMPARYFLWWWWDDSPWDEAREELLTELRRVLARRPRKAGAA